MLRFPASGFLTRDFKRLVSSCGFSRGISCFKFLWLVCELEKVVMCKKVLKKRERVSRISDGLEKCESVSNVNNKQIKRKF